jgi:hypothetical protein
MLGGIAADLSRRDVLFLAEAIDPRLVGKIDAIESDPLLVESMLEQEAGRVFERIMQTGPEAMLMLSPRFLFEIMLRRARSEIEQQAYTIERSARQRIPVFDSAEVAQFLGNRTIMSYLADMLASFTKVESMTVPIRVRKGVWHKIRFNDMDVESLIKLSETVDAERRFTFHKRIGDCCLFILGIFPEYVMSDLHHSPSGEKRRLPVRRLRRSAVDYEEEGRHFYKLAEEHHDPAALEMRDIMAQLHDKFNLARKPLNYISDNYLGFNKQKMFPSLLPS